MPNNNVTLHQHHPKYRNIHLLTIRHLIDEIAAISVPIPLVALENNEFEQFLFGLIRVGLWFHLKWYYEHFHEWWSSEKKIFENEGKNTPQRNSELKLENINVASIIGAFWT